MSENKATDKCEHGIPGHMECMQCIVDAIRELGDERVRELEAERGHALDKKLVAGEFRAHETWQKLERPACAAIRYGSFIIAGKRHWNCLETAFSLKLDKRNGEHGFMTTHGRFVGKAEARRLFDEAGMVSADPGGLRGTSLYSEDLY